MIADTSLNEDEWLALFRERLRAAVQFRKQLPDAAAEGTDSCRLVFSEADYLPGLIADKYNDLVVVQLLTQGMDSPTIRAAFLEVITQEVGPRAVFERTDPRIRELEEAFDPLHPGPAISQAKQPSSRERSCDDLPLERTQFSL